MQQLRVVDLAQTMGISSTELIFKLRSIGVSVASEDDTLDLSTVRAIITGETLQKRPREVIVRSQETAEQGANSSARDRVVRRRRRRIIKTGKEIREVIAERAEDAGEGAPAEELLVGDDVELDAAGDEQVEVEADEMDDALAADGSAEAEDGDVEETLAAAAADAVATDDAAAEAAAAEAAAADDAAADDAAAETPVDGTAVHGTAVDGAAVDAVEEEPEVQAEAASGEAAAAATKKAKKGRKTAPAAEEPAETPQTEPAEDVAKSAKTKRTVKTKAADAEVPAEEPAATAKAQPKAQPKAKEGVKPAAGTKTEAAVSAAEEDEVEAKPAPTVTEEELTSGRAQPAEEGPQRVRPGRAKTPLEQNLRELSPEEIKQRLQEQRAAEKARRESKEASRRAPGGRKAKAAADAREIRDLLNKFEEQKLKGQQEGGGSTPTRPAPRPMTGGRPGGKKGRRRGRDQDRRQAPPQVKRTIQFKDGERPEGPVILSEMVTARELAEKINVTAKDLLGLLIQKGLMVTTNQALPHELAEEICADLEIEAMVASAEEVIEFEREEAAEVTGPLEDRAPVVTVMGHVDHGKTSLLDSIRSSRVADQEAGGITQHIGASRIQAPDGRTVVFIDTPGHEAFTQMRARGAQVTDIVVLVVAADDGVMPQTLEAINHARAANVPLIVAINKIDKNNANPERVKQQLAEREVLIEEWGGDVPAVAVSAKSGVGIGDLLDMILLVSELKELRASTTGAARGIVLEARKEKGRGIVATMLMQQGTLHVGDYFFCGSTWGRVRAISDDAGKRIQEAGPSDPVELMGFDGVPGAGDILQVTEGEDKALEVSAYRSQKNKEESLIATRRVSLETLFDHMSEDETKELNVVVKADVQGSVEVLKDTLTNLATDKVKINTLHGSVGAVTTNDVNLASASNAIIIGFNVRPERTARELADSEQVDIRLYTVIYNLIDDVKKAMVGLLEPEYREVELGHAEVREVFRVPKVGAIAGSHVIDGVITRSAKVRLLRDNVVVFEGGIASLRRFKDDASEVRQGFECGIGLERYQDVKAGDVIEAYRVEEIAPEL